MALLLRKEANTAEYGKKKLHEIKAKAKRCQSWRVYLEGMKDMTSQELLDFVNEKYDGEASRSEEMQLPLNKAILQRIRQIKIQLTAKNKKKLFEFVIEGGGDIDDKIYNKMIKWETAQRGNFNVWKYELNPWNDWAQVIITHLDRKDDGQGEKTFYAESLPEQFALNINPKRFKKEIIVFLQEWIKYEQYLIIQ